MWVVQGEESLLGTWKYPAEFRSDAVELVRSSGRSFASVARELGVNQETLRHWVRSSERSQQPQDTGDTRAESELARLRTEVAELKTEREILRKAAAYFAQETKW
jgi:transposase